jgi:hypothetical protein
MNETEFGYRIRQLLNEGLERMDYKTVFRLERARQAALARYRPAPATAAAPTLEVAGGPALEEAGSGGWRWLQRVGLVTPLIALLVGFVAIHEWQRSKTIDELAAIDFAFLLDEAPVEAYADKGFGVFLKSGAIE